VLARILHIPETRPPDRHAVSLLCLKAPMSFKLQDA
jgi:hypothetical protein